MVTKGVPTASSQRYKANKILQEKKLSTPPTSGNDVLPLPIAISQKPLTEVEEALRAFAAV
jgi:hypothetical protein